MFARRVISFLFFLSLAGCTTLPDGPDQQVSLPAQLNALKQVNDWKIQGKMALRDEQQAVSANLLWKARPDDMQFRLTNTLGITLVNLKDQQGMVTLEADDQTYHDTNASALIARVTGWQVPVTQLLSWVKGLPGPTDQYTLNDKGLLQTLTPGDCAGCGHWQVSYTHYGKVNDSWLPYALTLTRADQPNTFIKIRIDRWTVK